MARRGQFGRSPRPAQSLTNTIIAIAREAQQRRDMTIMEAWQKGGLFEGKKVTDEMVLDHWRGRMKEVSKDDPMFDAYQNALMEYEYAIAESKMTVKHAEGKIGDRAAAQFYLNWAKKVPKNSEFYRILKRDAAQYMNRVKAKQRTVARDNSEEIYRDRMKSIENTYLKPGRFVADIITTVSRTGIVAADGSQSQGPVEANNQIFDATQGEASLILDIIGQFSDEEEGVWTGGERPEKVVSVGPSADTILIPNWRGGEDLTVGGFYKEMKRLDPNFKGPFTNDTFVSYYDRTLEGLNKSRALADKTGHASDVERIDSDIEFVTKAANTAKALPVRRQYEDAWDKKERILRDPNSTPGQLDRAIEEYRATVGTLAKDPAIKGDPKLVIQLTAESKGDESVTSLYDDFTGLGAAGPEHANSTAIDNVRLEGYKAEAELAADVGPGGSATWTWGERVDGVFTPKVGGTVKGIAPLAQVLPLLGGGAKTSNIPQPDGKGGYVQVMTVAVPARITGVDPNSDETIGVDGNPIVMDVYVLGGGQPPLYGWTNKDGIYLKTPYPIAPVTGNLDNGFLVDATQYATDPANLPAGFGIDKKSQKIVINDPEAAVRLFQPERTTESSHDPNIDFTVSAYALWANTPEGRRNLERMSKMPEWSGVNGINEREEAIALGAQMNPDGTLTPVDPLDMSRYHNDPLANPNLVPHGVAPIESARQDFLARQAEEDIRVGRRQAEMSQGQGVFAEKWGVDYKPLAVDTLSSTEFAALGAAARKANVDARRVGIGYQGGSSWETREAGGGVGIAFNSTLKVPTVNPSDYLPTPNEQAKPQGSTYKPGKPESSYVSQYPGAGSPGGGKGSGYNPYAGAKPGGAQPYGGKKA